MTRTTKNINHYLSRDLLWSIFDLISVDENDRTHDRLWTVLWSTHVCQEWRKILLPSTSIWGRLVLFKLEGPLESKSSALLLAVIERSGSSPLWIEVYARHRIDDPQDLLRLFLPTLWSKVERINLQGQCLSQMALQEYYLPLLNHPAPLLQRAHVNLYGRPAWAPPFDIQPVAFFQNTAPRLLDFMGEGIPISMQTTWLSGLTSLTTGPQSTFTKNVQETLEVLGRMTQLHTLILDHDISENVSSMEEISTLPTIHLKYLTYMAIRGYSLNGLALIDRVKRPPSGCLVNFGLYTLSSTPSPIAAVTALFDSVFESNVRHLYGSDVPEWICICYNGMELIISDRNCSQSDINYIPEISSKGIYLKFILHTPDIATLMTSIMGTISSSKNLQKITTLRLIVAGHQNRTLNPRFLLNFSSLETLEAHSETLLSLEAWSSWDRTFVPFPKLTKIRYLSLEDANHHAQALVMFLRHRLALKKEITTVEVVNTSNKMALERKLAEVPAVFTLVFE